MKDRSVDGNYASDALKKMSSAIRDTDPTCLAQTSNCPSAEAAWHLTRNFYHERENTWRRATDATWRGRATPPSAPRPFGKMCGVVSSRYAEMGKGKWRGKKLEECPVRAAKVVIDRTLREDDGLDGIDRGRMLNELMTFIDSTCFSPSTGLYPLAAISPARSSNIA